MNDGPPTAAPMDALGYALAGAPADGGLAALGDALGDGGRYVCSRWCFRRRFSWRWHG